MAQTLALTRRLGRSALAVALTWLATSAFVSGCAHRNRPPPWYATSYPQRAGKPDSPRTQGTQTPAPSSPTPLPPPHRAIWRTDAPHVPHGSNQVTGAASGQHQADEFERRQQWFQQHYAGARSLKTLRGKATYYADKFAGRHTASGELYRIEDFTAAHRTLPFGTVLRVRLRGSKRIVYVRVTDRGPFGRPSVILDLSRAAARRVGLLRAGVAPIVAEVVEWGATKRKRR